MTRETAHKILSAHQAFWVLGDLDRLEYTDAEVNDALEFAIAALESDPDAPDWSQAPDGFDWYAIDADGSGVWYEKEPIKLDYGYSGKCLSWKHIDKSFMKLYKRPDK